MAFLFFLSVSLVFPVPNDEGIASSDKYLAFADDEGIAFADDKYLAFADKYLAFNLAGKLPWSAPSPSSKSRSW